MEILQIKTDNIEGIANAFQDDRISCSAVKDVFGGTIEEYDVGKNGKKIIVRSQTSIKAIVIDCINGKIESIAFYGSLQISFNDLIAIFGNYRSIYSTYDETTQFFFNEGKSKGNYVICCNIDGIEKEQGYEWRTKQLSHLSIHLS